MTVMFVDLCGSTALSDTLDAEIYGDMLQCLRALGREIIARHGGLIVRVQGDGILALFGQPEAREDDGRRATEAALELHAAMRQLEVDPRRLPRGSLALHTGIHAGLVLLVEGGLELGRYEVLGPVPNVAARLSDQAEFDQILVSEETLGPHAHFFATGTRRVLSVDKGLQPLAVLQVLARAPVHNRFATLALRGLAPFVGRVAEMQALQQQLQAAQAAPPRLLQVRAGPGMGKTRLIDEFLRSAVAAGHEVHRGYCDGYLGAEPLQPFLQMLRTLFRIGHDTGPADAARLAGHALAEIDTSLVAQRDELLRALSLASPGGDARRGGAELTVLALKTLFERLAARRPVLLFIDDWQWADDASRQVLDALRSLPLPLCLLLATRDQVGSSAERGAVVLELAPLNEDEARQTIDHLLPGTDPFAAAQIHLYGGGNPLFIEELCHSAAVDVPASRPRSSGSGVAWLKSLIESRVSRLPEDQAGVARAAAVIGNVFPAWLLERITGHAADSPLLRELARQDFIFPTEQPGGLRFKHGITRDVVYDAVSLRERQATHRQVAQALAEQAGSGGFDDALESLAYHWGAGGDPAQAARFAAAAGDKAMAVSALDRARTQYRAALAALDEVGMQDLQARAQWIAIVQRLGMACVFDPLGLEDGLSLFERGVQLAADGQDDITLARAEYWLGYIAYAKGDACKSIVHAQHALDLAEANGDTRLAAQVRATLGQALAAAADYEHALPMLEQAVDLKRRNIQSGSALAVGAAYTLATKGLLLGDRGDFEAAHACLQQALALVGGTGHQVESSVLGWNTTVLLWQGRWLDALDSAARSSHIADQCRSHHLYAMHQAQTGYARWVLHQDPDALRLILDATAWVEARHGRLFVSLNYGWLSDALAASGRSDEARRHAARALWRARAGDRIGEAMACRAMALQARHSLQAARWLARADSSAAARASAHEAAGNRLCEARLALAAGRPEQARALLADAATAFERMTMTWHLGQAQALLAGL
jgi:tetratricopeptide (TPR) repeat protein